jgi:hypothetical protein
MKKYLDTTYSHIYNPSVFLIFVYSKAGQKAKKSLSPNNRLHRIADNPDSG